MHYAVHSSYYIIYRKNGSLIFCEIAHSAFSVDEADQLVALWPVGKPTAECCKLPKREYVLMYYINICTNYLVGFPKSPSIFLNP